MKLVANLFAFALTFAFGTAAAIGAPIELSSAAQQHVTRVSDSLTALRGNPSDKLANAQANHAFEVLLKDTSPSGDEALAALVGHYLGDSTEPECEILARGSRMLALLARFNRNPPLVQLPASTVHSRSEIIGQIKTGVRCE